jgi:MscS family membrane protein
MVDSIVDNISLRSQRRVIINLEISLTVEIIKLKELIPKLNELLKRTEIENSAVYFKETGKNAHVIEIMYFTGMSQTAIEFNALRSEINFAIIQILEEDDLPLASTTNNYIIVDKAL